MAILCIQITNAAFFKPCLMKHLTVPFSTDTSVASSSARVKGKCNLTNVLLMSLWIGVKLASSYHASVAVPPAAKRPTTYLRKIHVYIAELFS